MLWARLKAPGASRSCTSKLSPVAQWPCPVADWVMGLLATLDDASAPGILEAMCWLPGQDGESPGYLCPHCSDSWERPQGEEGSLLEPQRFHL